MRCGCVNVEMGSYANQIEVPVPPHMSAYATARVAAGLKPTICLDRCIASEVRVLWGAGIRTNGCCCGHNVAEPYIGVDPADAAKMRDMGYVAAAGPTGTFAPQRPLR